MTHPSPAIHNNHAASTPEVATASVRSIQRRYRLLQQRSNLCRRHTRDAESKKITSSLNRGHGVADGNRRTDMSLRLYLRMQLSDHISQARALKFTCRADALLQGRGTPQHIIIAVAPASARTDGVDRFAFHARCKEYCGRCQPACRLSKAGHCPSLGRTPHGRPVGSKTWTPRSLVT